MDKRQLHRSLVRLPLPFRKRLGRKLVIRPVTDANIYKTAIQSSAEETTREKETEAPLAKTPPKKASGTLKWSLVWLSIALILAGTGVVGGLLLTTLPPPPDCQKISPLAADGERLQCAQQAAASGKLEALVGAIAVVSGWPETHPLYPEAQRLMGEWSSSILALAQQKINQGDLQGANAVIRKIPVRSPLYPEAQAKLADWQQDWRQGEKITREVYQAMKAQQWLTASQKAQALSGMNLSYWRDSKLKELMQQMIQEKMAWQQLEEARDLAESNTPAQLQQAIAMVGKIKPKSYASSLAQAERNNWSRAIVKIAAERFKEQDFPGVLVVLQSVPADTSAYKEAQDWIRLTRATSAAKDDSLVALIDATTEVRQIGSQSPLYKQALSQKALWQSQLQDQIKLQFASAIASIDQPLTLQLAIEQAQTIALKQPKRILAQTHIASWRKSIHQIEDRAVLAQANLLAGPGTIDSLKAAVAQASKIESDRPLGADAQAAIALWNRQIESIEDKPILELAKGLAAQGNLLAAIQAARQVKQQRALYSEAQAAVSEWVGQIQIVEDRPILEKAANLAAEGSLIAAIQTAYSITAGRPLYNEAQAAIARWRSQLDAVDAARKALAGTSPYDTQSQGIDPL